MRTYCPKRATTVVRTEERLSGACRTRSSSDTTVRRRLSVSRLTTLHHQSRLVKGGRRIRWPTSRQGHTRIRAMEPTDERLTTRSVRASDPRRAATPAGDPHSSGEPAAGRDGRSGTIRRRRRVEQRRCQCGRRSRDDVSCHSRARGARPSASPAARGSDPLWRLCYLCIDHPTRATPAGAGHQALCRPRTPVRYLVRRTLLSGVAVVLAIG